jgi:SAM-dependent methyltransferase
MSAPVLVVFCMDTEGPCVDPQNAELLASWEAVDRAMEKLFDPALRARHPDSAGGGLRIGWFLLTWTGFATNPRGRAFGYHAVRDHYLERFGDAIAAAGDEHCWHYHHPPRSGVGNEWGLDWSTSDEHDAIVSRQLLERSWFPACFRAGGTILSPESSRWVDAWFPVDYSNRAPLELPGLVDWRSGVADWRLYHPDPEDFRRPGPGRRLLARCLDLDTGVYRLGERDVEAAFERAERGRPAIFACFDHDYRDIAGRVEAFCELVASVARRHPGVEWRYAAPVEAVRRYVDMPAPPRLELELDEARDGILIWSTAPLFQSFPWLAVRTAGDDVIRPPGDFVGRDATHWQWTPPEDLDWAELAVGGTTSLGAAAVAKLERGQGAGRTFLDRATERHPQRPRSIWEHSKLYPASLVERAGGDAEEMDAARQAAAILRQHLEPGASVLDVGCGAGHLWRSLEPLGLEYFGIDSYARGIEIGRALLELPASRLRPLALEELPRDERYDAVVSLSVLLYAPDFRAPLDALAGAATRLLVIRSSFGDETEVRYLRDEALEPGHALSAYFSVFARADVETFLRERGFAVAWLEDERQRDRFGGEPEVVAGIPLPYEFLVAERR